MADHELTDADKERFNAVGWYDYTMKARHWFGMLNVVPQEAAMLLCRINPLAHENPEQFYPDDDRSSPDKYRLLLRAFNDAASTSLKHRTLLDWLALAREKELPYHKWIDEYVAAMETTGHAAESAKGASDARAPLMPCENAPGAISAEPHLQAGSNKRAQVEAWVKYQAYELVKDGDNGIDLADRIRLLAEKYGYKSERGPMTNGSIVKMFPGKITGGRGKNRRQPEK